jgi:hypothetical protein
VTVKDRLVIIGAPLGLAVLTVLPPADRGWALCPVALLTGTACPGCGMTRAVSHLLRGDLPAALGLHPLVIPVLVIATVTWGWFVLHRLGKAGRLPSPLVNLTLSGLALALVGVWVARLTTGTLPPI